MTKETHRAVVAWVCGVPFVVLRAKQAKQLMMLSSALPRLQENADGSLATMSKTATNALENQMVVRYEVRDVVCTDCPSDEKGRETSSDAISAMLERMLGAGKSH